LNEIGIENHNPNIPKFIEEYEKLIGELRDKYDVCWIDTRRITSWLNVTTKPKYDSLFCDSHHKTLNRNIITA